MQVVKVSWKDAERIGAVILLIGTIGQQATQLIRGSLEAIDDWRTILKYLKTTLPNLTVH
jgi:hypothetical protein